MKKFNHLNIPNHWQQYWTRYPEGYTILEALINWVGQVNKMTDSHNTIIDNVESFRNEIDSFIDKFDIRLQDEVTNTLEDWQASGFLDVVIGDALQTEMDDFKEETENKLNDFKEDLLDTPYYREIKYAKHRDDVSGTDYYITHIPHKDRDGNIIRLRHEYQHDNFNQGMGEKPSDFSARTGSSVVINGSLFNTDTKDVVGIQIKDGIIQQSKHYNDSFYTLGIKEDNTLIAYPPQISAEEIVDDGVVDALTGFYPIIQDGKKDVPDTHIDNDQRHPRQVIAQLANKDILILSVVGNLPFKNGMNIDDCVRILMTNYSVVFAYLLDGGGSTSTVVRGVKINPNMDNQGSTERSVGDFLTVKKESFNPTELSTITSDLNQLLSYINTFLRDYARLPGFELGIQIKANNDSRGIESWYNEEIKTKLYLRDKTLLYRNMENSENIFLVADSGNIQTKKGIIGDFMTGARTVDDLNSVLESGIYWANPQTKNTPTYEISWAVYQIQPNSNSRLQIAVPFTSNPDTPLKTRRFLNGEWEDWINKT